VGQDEDALSLVGRANFSRAEYAPRRSVTDSIQLFDDVAESETNVARTERHKGRFVPAEDPSGQHAGLAQGDSQTVVVVA